MLNADEITFKSLGRGDIQYLCVGGKVYRLIDGHWLEMEAAEDGEWRIKDEEIARYVGLRLKRDIIRGFAILLLVLLILALYLIFSNG